MHSELFSRNFHIRFYEAGPDNRLSLPSLINYIQELAHLQTTSQKIGIEDMHELGLTWFVARIRLEMEYRPESGDSVTGYIWDGKPQRLLVPRYYIFKSVQTGKIVAKCSTYWLMIDLKTRHPVLPEQYYHPIRYDNEQQFPTPHLPLVKIPNYPAEDPMEIHIGQYHLDSNNHVNNRFYLAFAETWLAHKLGRPVDIQSVQINFNSALEFEDVAICSGKLDGNQFRVVGHTLAGNNVFSSSGLIKSDRELKCNSGNYAL